MVAAAPGRSNQAISYPREWIGPAVARASLPASAKHLTLTMLLWAAPGTSVIEGHSLIEIAGACNLSKSTVIRMLGLLERTGWMKRTVPDNQQQAIHETASYQFLIPESGVSSGVSPVDPGHRGEPDQAVLFTVVPPTGVLPGSTEVPTTSASVDQNPLRASREDDLTSATDNRAGASGQNAGSVVAAYIDSHEKTWGMRPPIVANIKRIGRDAKKLLAQGIEYATVLDAAIELGTTHHANLPSIANRLVVRRENDPRYHSWQNIRTIAPFSADAGSWDAVGTWGREVAVAPNWDDAGPSNWDATVRWYAGDDGDDYHGYDGAELDDDEITEAYL